MSPYILIHGAWHANWSWKYVVPLLEKHGHDVINLNLPGHDGQTDRFNNINLETYVDYISKIVGQIEDRVILVGHSMAGVIISQLAERIPEKIKKLVYVCAFIPENGETLSQTARKSDSLGVSTEMKIDEKANSVSLKKSSRIIDLFFDQCDKRDTIEAMALLQNEPFQPFIDPISISKERFGTVPKLYIGCTLDKAIMLKDQRRMYSAINSEAVMIDADHSPFFSKPKELVNAMLNYQVENKPSMD